MYQEQNPFQTEADKFNTEAADKDTNEFFIIGDIQDPDKSRVEEVARQLDAENTDYDFGIQIGDAIDQAADYTGLERSGRNQSEQRCWAIPI